MSGMFPGKRKKKKAAWLTRCVLCIDYMPTICQRLSFSVCQPRRRGAAAAALMSPIPCNSKRINRCGRVYCIYIYVNDCYPSPATVQSNLISCLLSSRNRLKRWFYDSGRTTYTQLSLYLLVATYINICFSFHISHGYYNRHTGTFSPLSRCHSHLPPRR